MSDFGFELGGILGPVGCINVERECKRFNFVAIDLRVL